MRSINKNIMVITLIAMPILFSGCALFGVVPSVDEYVETMQEGVADNEALKAYVEELRPVISSFYKEGRSLEDMQVKGNDIHVKINLGETTSPYGSVKDLMVYETTRVSHAVMTYRKYEVIEELYKIVLDFTNEKEVILYKNQAVEKEGIKEFTPETILNAVKR